MMMKAQSLWPGLYSSHGSNPGHRDARVQEPGGDWYFPSVSVGFPPEEDLKANEENGEEGW